MNEQITASRGKTKAKTNRVTPFITKLFRYVNDPELIHIISWDAGDSFTVRDKDLFTERILNGSTKNTKFQSFRRQLNNYGFLRTKA